MGTVINLWETKINVVMKHECIVDIRMHGAVCAFTKLNETA